MIELRVEELGFQLKKENLSSQEMVLQPSSRELDNNSNNSVSRTAGRWKYKKDLAEAFNLYRDEFYEAGPLAKALGGCRLCLDFNQETVSFDHRLCRSKACPFCGQFRLRKEQDVLAYLLREAQQNKDVYGMLTLTVSHTKEMSAKKVLTKLQKCWSRLNSNKSFHRLVKSYFKAIDYTVTKNGFHYHYHLAIVLRDGVRVTPAKKELSNLWKAAGGGFIRFNRYDDIHRKSPETVQNGIYEMTSYIGKDQKKFSLKKSVEIHCANYRKRMFSYGGEWSGEKLKAIRELLAEEKKAAMAEIELPEIPLPIDEETGELLDIPTGKVDPHTACLKAQNGDKAHIYKRDLLEWIVRWNTHPSFYAEWFAYQRWLLEAYAEERNPEEARKLFSNGTIITDLDETELPF